MLHHFGFPIVENLFYQRHSYASSQGNAKMVDNSVAFESNFVCPFHWVFEKMILLHFFKVLCVGMVWYDSRRMEIMHLVHVGSLKQ